MLARILVAVALPAIAFADEPAVPEPVVLPESVVVTGTRSPRPTSALPVTVEVIERAAVRDGPASTPDALLRTIPSFQTFRRSTSLAADPSSQGLALRGIGPSAVSRALLLDDGVPVNDPFGGWIAWRAVPRLGLDRIEVAPGGASALHGSFALGGVVALVPRAVPEGTSIEAEVSAGSFGTASGAVRAAGRRGGLGAALEVDALRTDGYRLVAPAQAGAVDGRSGADHVNLDLRGAWDAAPGLQVRGGLAGFGEEQRGGTQHTTSAARSLTGRVGIAWTGESGRLDATAYGGLRSFEQERARVASDRGEESLAARQRVPSTDAGGSLVLSPPERAGHALAAGLDVRRVDGEAREALFPAAPGPTVATAREAGGSQLLGGVFAEDAWRVRDELVLAGALRLDGWRNGSARSERSLGDGSVVATRYPPRGALELSPRLAVLWRPVPALALRASAYRAFRAPTLNELYRTFQVGTVITAPEPELVAERLTGAEAGPELSLGALRLRATGFWNVLDDPATIVTLAAPLGDGATRQRANLGRARIRGLEARVGWAAGPLGASLAWTATDARVVAAPGHPDLVGKHLAQDPVHRVTAELRAGRGRSRGGVAVRWASGQWEDDRNTLRMAGYAVVDADLAVRLAGAVEVFAAAENLLDRRYLVGRAGIDTLAAPRLIRAGLRLVADAR